MADKLYGGIEAGGTKFICAVGSSPDAITSHVQIPTTTPAETLTNVIAYFKSQPPLESIGIGSFGPIDLNESSPTYGHITTTPKAGWANTDLLGVISDELDVPVALNTDVNCAALGEQLYGAGKNLSTVAYITVGTGIGVGYVVDGEIPTARLGHTEMGHMVIPHERKNHIGACPYHDSCLEGLASGTALQKFWGVPAEQINDDAAWEEEAKYLAYGISNTIFGIIPDRIIIGGGVMAHERLIEDVRSEVMATLNGYLQIAQIVDDIDGYVAKPSLGDMSGVTGALALATRHTN